MQKGMNAKAQELSIGTLVLIVLGIIVLVLVILGFTMGWNNLLEKINIFNPASNLDSVVTACSTAAVASQTDAYCNEFRKVKINGENQLINCQYGDVQARLEDKKIQCTRDSDESAMNYCRTLLLANKADAKTKVNNKLCYNAIPCETPTNEAAAFTPVSLGGQLSETCPATNTTIKEGFTEKATNSNKVCCVAR